MFSLAHIVSYLGHVPFGPLRSVFFMLGHALDPCLQAWLRSIRDVSRRFRFGSRSLWPEVILIWVMLSLARGVFELAHVLFGLWIFPFALLSEAGGV